MKNRYFLAVLPLLFLASCSQNTSSLSSSKQSVESSQNIVSSVDTNDDHLEVEAAENYSKEDAVVYRDNKKIVGELYIPDNNMDEFPLIILSHGFGANMSSTRNDALTFTKQGYASFVFDFIMIAA